MAWNGSDQGKAKVEGQGQEKVKRRGRGQEGSSKFRSPTPTPNFNYKALLAGAIVVALGCGAIWWFVGRDDGAQGTTHKAQGTSHTIAEVKPQIATNKVAEVEGTKDEPETLPPWKDEYMKSTAMCLKYSTLFKATTNNTGMIIERYRLPNGKTWRYMKEMPPLFENRCDQAIAMVLGDETGSYIPAAPGLDNIDLDEEFQNSLLSPIVINDDDKPEDAALKLVVKQARKEIAELIKSGDTRSVGEILSDHVKINNRNAEMYADVSRQVEAVRKSEGEAFAREYLKIVNDKLVTYGVPPLEGYFDRDETDENTNNEGDKENE